MMQSVKLLLIDSTMFTEWSIIDRLVSEEKDSR